MAHRRRGKTEIMGPSKVLLTLTIATIFACMCTAAHIGRGHQTQWRQHYDAVRERRSPRGLFSPRLEYDEWTPLGRGDPLKNDPTYDYVPPVLDRVHYWIDPSSRTPDVPQPTPAVALPAPTSSPTTAPSVESRTPNQAPATTVIVYPANVRSPISTGPPEDRPDPFDAVADARLDAHPFLTFVDGPKFTPKQPPITPPTLPPHKRVTHYGEFRPLSTQQPQKHHSHGPSPPQPIRHSSHPYRMSSPYYTPTRITHIHPPHMQMSHLETSEMDISTAPGQPPTPLQMLVPPPLPGTEPQIPFVPHEILPQEQTVGQSLTSTEMQKPIPVTNADLHTTPFHPVFTAPTTSAPRIVIPTHPPTTESTPIEEAENVSVAETEVKEPEQYMVPPPNEPLSPVPDFSESTVEIQESLELTTSEFPSSTTDKWTTYKELTSELTQSMQPPTTTPQPILYVTFPPTTTSTQTPPTPTTTPPTTTTPSLTTDPLFSHYKQPSAPLRGPMYLIIEGHSKVKTYGAGKNSIHGIPVVGSGEKEASKGPRRRVSSGRSLWEDPISIGMLPPPETDPSENDVLRGEWLAATKEKHGVFVVPAWGTPRRHEAINSPIQFHKIRSFSSDYIFE